MISKDTFDALRIELSIKAKNGIDFIIAASIIWMIISYIWTLEFNSYDKSILTFIVGSLMLPLALLLSKVFKTTWKNKDNPLEPLGLWLNFAQLFYFPFLVFILLVHPDYFVMTYIIITGAHFFPYGWYYKTVWYSIFAGIIVVGILLLGLMVSPEKMYYLPLLFSPVLMILAILLYQDYKKKERKQPLN